MKRPTLRWTVAVLLILLGAVVAIYGLMLSNANPRTNAEDNVAWVIFAIGAMILGSGIYLPLGEKTNRIGVMAAAFMAPIALFALIVMLFWLAIAMGVFERQ